MSDPIDLQALVRDIHELLILSVLRGGPGHGYRIALDVERRSDGMFSLQHGTLYPILHRMEKRGWIEGEWSRGDGRRRKEYRLRRTGRTHLEAKANRIRSVFAALDELLEEGP